MADQDSTLTQEYLQSIFEYKDGELYWKVKKSNAVNIGDKAGCIDKCSGYVKVRVNSRMIGAHTIIFMMHYGFLPNQIDHIDRDKSNNRIENLRIADPSQNMANAVFKAGKSNKKNVLWRKDREKWTVRIKFRGRYIARGAFDTVEEAEKYAILLRNQLHKEYANHSSLSSNPNSFDT